MKTHTCDSCGTEIGPDNPGAPHSIFQLNRAVALKDASVKAFYAEIRLVAFEGANSPDLCQGCLLNAIAHPAPLPEPIKLSVGIGTDASNLPVTPAPTS